MIKDKTASLVIVGSGIKFFSHLTTEAKAYIEQSDKVLYLVNEPAIEQWIKTNNTHTESLQQHYFQHTYRQDTYKAIREHILDELHKNQHVCVVIYGHPAMYVQPAIEAVKQAQKEGYFAKILPGISAEDCLFADLLINPGSHGYLSFEATDFLVHRRPFDPAHHLILWQVGLIGSLINSFSYANTTGISVLIEYLNDQYDSNHKVILYEAAQYPGFESRIETVSLSNLHKAHFTQLTTLYIPPSYKGQNDKTMLATLGINLQEHPKY